MSSQTTIVINGQSVTVPTAFAGIYEYLGASGGDISDINASILGDTVGQFEISLNEIESFIKTGINWGLVKSQFEAAGLQNNPDYQEGYQVISAFAAGDFSIIDEGFVALRSFLAQYPDSTPLLEAFADIDGYEEAIEEGVQNFNEALANQLLEGSDASFDIVNFSNANSRADYSISYDADGQIVIVGPDGGSATLVGIDKLVFGDIAYNLQISAKAQSIAADALDNIVDLYVAYFNRAPEAEGLGYWIDQFQAGKTLDQIAVEFFNAGVTFSGLTGYTADMPLGDFVSLVYANVLGRSGDTAPPQGDIDYWLSELDTGAVTREGLVQRFLSDARLFAEDPNFGWVTNLLNNKVEFGKIHAILLGIDYTDAETAYATSQELAALVTAEGYDGAVSTTGLSADDYLVA